VRVRVLRGLAAKDFLGRPIWARLIAPPRALTAGWLINAQD